MSPINPTQSYSENACNFFGSLGAGPKNQPPQRGTQHGRSNQPILSFDDVVGIALNSKTRDEAIHTIGTIGEGYVFNEFQEKVAERMVKATAVSTGKNAQPQGVVDNFLAWIGDSKVGQSLGFGTGVTTEVSAVKSVASATPLETAATPTSTAMNIIGMAYGAYDLIKNFGSLSPAHGALSGLAVGAGIGSLVPGIGTVVGGLVGMAVGGLLSLFHKSGKDKDQKARDAMRGFLQQAGVIDEKFTIGLADGSRYDIGIDGKPKAEFGGRHPFDIDLKDPLAGKIAMHLGPITLLSMGGNKKLASDLCGYLTNAALSNAGGDETKAMENVRSIYSQFKIQPEQLVQGLAQLLKGGVIDEQAATVYLQGLKTLFSKGDAPVEDSVKKKTKSQF